MTSSLAARALSRRIPHIYPALPPGWQRDPFLHLVQRVAPTLGVGRAAIHTWARLAAMTRPNDWTADDREPFVYAAASELAKILGLSEPRLRCHTVELARAGLIDRRTAANGGRALHAGTGLYFSGAIARLSELIDLDRQLTAARHQAMYLRGQRSTHRRCLREALEALQQIAPSDPRIIAIGEAFAAWPRADRLHSLTLDELAKHEADADALTRSVLDLLENLTVSDDQPLESERSYIQDTTQDLSVICNARVHHQQRTGKPVQDNPKAPAPNGAEEDYENKCEGNSGPVKSEWITKLGPDRLFDLASPEMQFYLSGRCEPERLRFHDFIWSVERRLPELGIHPSAWAEACAQMGDDCAAIAVLILDARRASSITLIISPGGYLRGMTRAFQQGRLNLMGSLIGLSKWRRTEQAL